MACRTSGSLSYSPLHYDSPLPLLSSPIPKSKIVLYRFPFPTVPTPNVEIEVLGGREGLRDRDSDSGPSKGRQGERSGDSVKDETVAGRGREGRSSGTNGQSCSWESP